MGFLKLWRRLTRPHAQARERFKDLIKSGRNISTRLERFVATPLSEIPLEERMTTDEVHQWFAEAEKTIIEVFGQDSRQTRKWVAENTELARLTEREIMRRSYNQAASYIRSFERSIELLEEFKK